MTEHDSFSQQPPSPKWSRLWIGGTMVVIGVLTDTSIPQIRENITTGTVIVAVGAGARFALGYSLAFPLLCALEERRRRWAAGPAAVVIGLLTVAVGYAAVWLARLP